MSTPIKNRYDFMLLFDVKDGNPNGDPDAGNLPRVDAETGEGLITDVCLKRKIRNYVELVKTEEGKAKPGFNIYVKEKTVLARAHVQAFQELGIDVGQERSEVIPPEMVSAFSEIEFCDGMSLSETDDEVKSLTIAAGADKKAIGEWLKEASLTKGAKTFVKNLIKKAKPRKPSAEETEKGREWMCKNFYDIRTFGAVLALKSAPNCGQVRGPVQLTFARSIDPIVTLEHAITRMAVATEAESEKQGGGNRTMGRKFTVPYGLYVAYGFISPALAKQTGFSEEDLNLLWEALVGMFDQDHSAARGRMAMKKILVFKHESALGNAPSDNLFDLVQIERKEKNGIPRKFTDYKVTIAGKELSKGIGFPADEIFLKGIPLPKGVELLTSKDLTGK